MKKLLISIAMMLFASQTAIAENTELVSKWYSALKTSNEAMFKELIADDATLELNPLEVTQTKAEYIAALNNWEATAKDLTLIMKGVKSTGETTVRAMVCYKFPESSSLNEERFVILDGKITNFSQNTRSDEC